MVNQTTRPSNGLPELQTEYFLAERDKEQSHNASWEEVKEQL
jgi:hypothetical protein